MRSGRCSFRLCVIGLVVLAVVTPAAAESTNDALLVKVEFVYRPAPSAAQKSAVLARIRSDPHVRQGSVRYISRKEAFAELARKYPELAKSLPFNPLPDLVSLTLKRAANFETFRRRLRALPGVEES